MERRRFTVNPYLRTRNPGIVMRFTEPAVGSTIAAPSSSKIPDCAINASE